MAATLIFSSQSAVRFSIGFILSFTIAIPPGLVEWFLPPFPPPIAGCQSGIRKRYRPSGFPRLRISGSCPGFFGVVMLSGSTAHTCAPCGLPACVAGAFSRSLPLPFPAVACFPAASGPRRASALRPDRLRLAVLGTCGERPPWEACGTLGRGPCSRPFPVCVRL